MESNDYLSISEDEGYERKSGLLFMMIAMGLLMLIHRTRHHHH